MKKAFTLIEILIVVAILGILAAVVLPTVKGQTAKAHNAAAKEILHTLRRQIEYYKFEHKDLVPGYRGASTVAKEMIVFQFTNCTKVDGTVSLFVTKTGDYVYGPYLPKMPKNPFNGLSNIKIVPETTEFSAVADGTSSGWLYKIGKGDIRLNSKETDDQGVKHYEL